MNKLDQNFSSSYDIGEWCGNTLFYSYLWAETVSFNRGSIYDCFHSCNTMLVS